MDGNCIMHSHAQTQPVPALSSAEAEYYAICSEVQDGILLQSVMDIAGFGVHQVPVYTNSAAAKGACQGAEVGREEQHCDPQGQWQDESRRRLHKVC